MGIVQVLMVFSSLSLIEILLSMKSPWWGLGFAFSSVFLGLVDPAFFLLPLYLISFQYFYYGVEKWRFLRLTAEARLRQSYIRFKRACCEQALAERVRVL